MENLSLNCDLDQLTTDELRLLSKRLDEALTLKSIEIVEIETSSNLGEPEYNMDTLLQQNHALENEVSRLCGILGEVTKGNLKRGYLYKWREREMSFASKWGLRYFELKGNSLSYFEDDSESRRPRRTIDLSNCVIKNEGTKKLGSFHLFGIYLAGSEQLERGPNSGVLLRLSSESKAEADQWMDLLYQATMMESGNTSSTPVIDTPKLSHSVSLVSATDPEYKNAFSSQPTTLVSPTSTTPLSPQAKKQLQHTSETLERSIQKRQLQAFSLHLNSPHPSSMTTTPATTALRDQLPQLSRRPSQQRLSSRNQKRPPVSYPASKAIHLQNVSSPLSSDARPGEGNYRGFFHLGLIIFIISHFRLVLDNFQKYGVLVGHNVPLTDVLNMSILHTSYGNGSSWLVNTVLSLFSWLTSALVCFMIEYTISRPKYRTTIPDYVIVVINGIIGTLNIVIPVLWVWYSKTHPLACMIYLFQSTIIWMKLISYVHCNRDIRLAIKLSKQADHKAATTTITSNTNTKTTNVGVSDKQTASLDNNAKPPSSLPQFSDIKNMEAPFLQYPQNLTLGNLLYFCIAPTLCYQLNYPRSPKIRWNYVLTILIRMIFCIFVIMFFVEQYIIPSLVQSIQPMKDRDIWGIFTRLMKIAIPNTYIWLTGFYAFFHLWLNLLAELTRFGDRLFYKDWWNARTIDIYWRNWNLPVHHWMVRHFYYPLLRAGASKRVAVFSVFFLSAALHELIISTPFRRISLHAFLGMLAQAPLVYVTRILDKTFDNALVGNVMFWLLFCIVGQPMGIIMYYYDAWKG